jgi:hypothetical protein
MLTQTLLKEKLNYDPITGIFTWKQGKYKNKPAGTIAGKLPDQGYVRINIDKKEYKAHRLAWLYMYGVFPPKHLDHINRNREDNSIANLRIADDSINSKNKTIYKNNSTGFHGVTAHGSRWRARINVKGKKIHLGIFDTAEEAAACRKQAEQKYGFHKNHGKIINV